MWCIGVSMSDNIMICMSSVTIDLKGYYANLSQAGDKKPRLCKISRGGEAVSGFQWENIY